MVGNIKKIITLLVVFVIVFTPYNTYAVDYMPVDSGKLINNAIKYDAKKVEYQGEVIGDVMKRGEYAWINVNDGNNAIGIYLRTTEVDKIKTVGNYKYKGDIVKILGTFHRACKQHSGELDIHADRLIIVKKGYRINHAFDIRRAVWGFFLLTVAATLFVINRKLRNFNTRKS